MATDYYFLLLQVVQSLDPNTPDARRAVCERARQIVDGHFHGRGAQLPSERISTERTDFELAVARLEQEFGDREVESPQSTGVPLDAAIATSDDTLSRNKEWATMLHLSHVEAWLRRYGLALCCIVAPLLLAVVAFNWTVSKLVPEKISRIEISYQPSKAQPAKERSKRGVHEDGATSEADPNIYLLSQHIAGRYGFATICAFLYLACFSSLMFTCAVVVSRLGWVALIGGFAGFGILGFGIADSRWIQNPFDIARPLLIDRLFNAADGFEALRPIASERRTGESVTAIMEFNEFVGVVAVGMIFLALFALSIRPLDAQLEVEGLRARLKAIRWTLILGSSILVISVILTKMLVDWPLRLIDQAQAAALKPIADALAVQFGATGTIIAFSTFAPAIVAWYLDVNRFKQRHDRPMSEAATEALAFAPKSMFMSLVAIIAPVATSPVVEIIKLMVSAVSAN